MKKGQLIISSFSCLVVLFVMSGLFAGESSKQARKELVAIGITPNQGSFNEAARRFDKDALELFVQVNGLSLEEALVVAVEESNDDSIIFFLKAGVNPDTKKQDQFEVPIIVIASENNDLATVKNLEKYGVNFGATSKVGNNALIIVSGKRESEDLFYFILSKMIKEKADVSHANSTGWTAVMGATTIGDTKRVESLLAVNADVTIASQLGTATKVAEMGGYTELAAILRKVEIEQNLKKTTEAVAVSQND